MKFFKQLFCIHVFKCEEEEFLVEKWELVHPPFTVRGYDYFNHYADHMKCVKCEKTKLIEKRKRHVTRRKNGKSNVLQHRSNS